MKKLIFLLLFSFYGVFNFSKAYEVDLSNPTENIQSEVVIETEKNDWKKEVFSWKKWVKTKKDSDDIPFYEKLFKTLIIYIWLFTWVVAFWAVVYAGFYLLTSAWNPEDLKKANKTLVWWLVGIFVSLLAYVLVKVLINLF